MRYTAKIIFNFRPVQPSETLASVEWLMEYYFNWKLDTAGGWDMGKIKYEIYNYNSSTWTTLSSDGHHFHKNNAGDDTEYIGHLTTQMFYVKIDTNPSYYVSDDGLVRTAINFTEDEDNEYTYTYTKKNAELTTIYNGIILSD